MILLAPWLSPTEHKPNPYDWVLVVNAVEDYAVAQFYSPDILYEDFRLTFQELEPPFPESDIVGWMPIPSHRGY